MPDETKTAASPASPRILPTRDAYDAWAAGYDRDENATRDLDAARLRAAPPPLAGRRIVEIGAGTGKNTVYYAEQADHVTAIDLSEPMLERARAKLAGQPVDFIAHDIRQPWPLDDSSADGVSAHLVLEHIEAIGPVLAEAARVLKPGGWCLVSEFHPFRQLRGGRARFDSETGDDTERSEVEAYLHSVSDFVRAGLENGFVIKDMGEWLEERPDAATTPPRLLTLLFEKPAG